MHEQRRKKLKSQHQAIYRKRKKQRTTHESNLNLLNRQVNNGINRHELGRMDQICIHCGAKFWIEEKTYDNTNVSRAFTKCCAGGKVNLPPLLEPPSYLLNLYTSSNPDANLFRKNIRAYNSILACTSFGANIDERFQGQGISNF